jgi:hypothetical protein
MIEPELQNYLSGINQSLTEIKNKKHPGVWRSFFNGVFSALGYFVGLALVITIVGFIAQKTGLLKNFQTQAKEFQEILRDAKSYLNSGSSQQEGDTVTLPDGRKVKIVPAN